MATEDQIIEMFGETLTKKTKKAIKEQNIVQKMTNFLRGDPSEQFPWERNLTDLDFWRLKLGDWPDDVVKDVLRMDNDAGVVANYKVQEYQIVYDDDGYAAPIQKEAMKNGMYFNFTVDGKLGYYRMQEQIG